MTNKVALVTGAGRGLGRGIARGLGMKGLTVYITGRNADQLAASAAAIDEAGGKGLAIVCDHADDEQVRAAYDRIRAEAGRLDLVVNNAAALPWEIGMPGGYWEKSLAIADQITVGLRSNYVSCVLATPLMLETGGGVIANISAFGASSYYLAAVYGAAKAGTDKMSHDMAIELGDRDLTVISFWPGLVKTDTVESLPDELMPDNMKENYHLLETPEWNGLVLAAILEDPDRKAYAGQAVVAARAAMKYGVRDLDGKVVKDWTGEFSAPLVFT